MRPIKFRGKRLDNNEWVYGYLISPNRIMVWDKDVCMRSESYQVDPATVGQFTGRRDCKRTEEYPEGQEIYGGDILKDDIGEIGIVKFGKLPLDKAGDCVCRYSAFYVECLGKLGQAPSYECQDIGDWMEVIGNQANSPEVEKE